MFSLWSAMGRETIPVSQDCTTAAATRGRLTTGEKTQHGRVSTAPSWQQRHTPWVYYWPAHGRQVSSLPKLNQCNAREGSWAVWVCPIIETKSFQNYLTQHLLCKLYLPGCPNQSTGSAIGLMHVHCREHVMEMRGKNNLTIWGERSWCKSWPEGGKRTEAIRVRWWGGAGEDRLQGTCNLESVHKVLRLVGKGKEAHHCSHLAQGNTTKGCGKEGTVKGKQQTGDSS